MSESTRDPHDRQVLQQVLGYLNYSAGAHEPQLYANLNELFRLVQLKLEPSALQRDGALWRAVVHESRDGLQQLQSESPAFADSAQATAALDLLEQHVLPAYREFHSDLLFHQNDDSLFNSFFVSAALEAILSQEGPWEDVRRITRGAMRTLNDYVGYRPVATLETQKTEPYVHERVRPIPLYIDGAGVAIGRYREVVSAALELLRATDPDLLRSANFDPHLLDELALDPRAFDFDHPVNKRPNYHFGEWDGQSIDDDGRFRRFVVQQVTMDALMTRVESTLDASRDDLIFEAASVLAGTILMGAGISGWGPGAHDSEVTLGKLVQRIASYRDQFYERLVTKVAGRRADRLRHEAETLKQPFGGARQHLNAQLARLRASQMEHVGLARLFARMGHFEAARDEASRVPAPSARMLCQMDCWLTAADTAVERGEVHDAATYMPLIRDLLDRAIECGAIIDPWSILGFDAQFSLFPALENSIHDERADELVALMHRVFLLYSRIWSEAAARHDQPLCSVVDAQYHATAEWWRQFAAHTVESVEAMDPLDVYHGARHVAQALDLWHQGGAATGDVAFWAPHAEIFDSPQAFALVVEALLLRGDFLASMGLLMFWLSKAEDVPLEQGEYSFHELAELWLLRLQATVDQGELAAWPHVRRFFDYLEANAESYWRPPRFEWNPDALDDSPLEDDDDEADEGVFDAAYDNMVFQGESEDGIEGSIYETPQLDNHDALLRESHRVERHLAFTNMLARLWKLASVAPKLLGIDEADGDTRRPPSSESLCHWAQEAAVNLNRLTELLDQVRSYRLKKPQADSESLLQYDRERLIKESLLEHVVMSSIEMSEALQFLSAAAVAFAQIPVDDLTSESHIGIRDSIELFAALLKHDAEAFRASWPRYLEKIRKRPLLYVPLAKGGCPQEIVRTRMRQRRIQDLLAWLPRLGLVAETCELIEMARLMERDCPVGPGAVTEFDELFKIGYRAVVECLVRSAETWNEKREIDDDEFVSLLEQFTSLLLESWLAHSRTLRLSVLEKVSDDESWDSLVEFIRTFGEDLFTQQFLNLGNVRAILHQGVASWLEQMQQEEFPEEDLRLIEALEEGLSVDIANEHLSVVLEAIVENYGEYRDYNSTTTQSDRGDLLYTLLDFLRLRNEYDRMNWKLTPVVLAHEILVRRGHDVAADMWRRAMTQRTSKRARSFLKQLGKLQQKYAMRMPSVSDRLGEQFVRPLSIDRMCAMVRPAIVEIKRGGTCRTFELLHRETTLLTRKPTGAGLDVPAWLAALDDEVTRACRRDARPDFDEVFHEAVTAQALTREETRHQLELSQQRRKDAS